MEKTKCNKNHSHICNIIIAIIAIGAIAAKIYVYTTYAFPDILSAILFLAGDIALIFAAFLIGRKRSRKGKDLEQARIAAEKANEAKSEFLANMSHEIRTPINAILGMNEMIIRESRDPDITQYARNIENASSSLLYLVNDILDFSKIESGRMEIVNVNYDLSSLVNDIQSMFQPKAEQKGLQFTTNIDPSIPNHLYGDPLRLQQICSNLISNAIKYTDTGKVEFELNWEKKNDKDLSLKISVSDTGKGIREDDLGILFDKFQRIDLKNNNSIEGTGLGLAITKNITSMMDGDIHVKSVYGSGSTFTVNVVQKYRDEEGIGNCQDVEEHAQNQDKRCGTFSSPEARILVVDDTPLNLQVIQNLLKKTDMQIDTANSGAECLELLKTHTYDVILMDDRMPHMSGSETLKEIRNQNRVQDGTKIIVLTANAMPGARDSYLAEGFDEYIPKPIKPSNLEMILKYFIPESKIREKTEKETVSHPVKNNNLPDWIYKSRELNPDSGIELCGTPEIYLETLNNFYRAANDTVAELEYTFGCGDIEDFTIKIHSVKSTAKLIGAERLSAMAQELENAGNEKNAAYIKEHLPAVITLYHEIISGISPLTEKNNPEPELNGNIEPEHVKGIMSHLKEYVDDFNDDAVSSMLKALSSYRFPGKDQRTFDDLKKAHDNIDWSKMQELLANY